MDFYPPADFLIKLVVVATTNPQLTLKSNTMKNLMQN